MAAKSDYESEDKWITVNGAHIKVDKGQSPRDALEQLSMHKVDGQSTNKEVGNTNKSKDSVDVLLGEEYIGYKGQSAIDKLMLEKRGHIKSAFHREDIGDIDLIWGDESCGLQHIINRRNEQNIDLENFTSNLADVICNGEFKQKNNRGNFEFWYQGKMAIISPELHGNKLTFLLTAYKRKKK